MGMVESYVCRATRAEEPVVGRKKLLRHNAAKLLRALTRARRCAFSMVPPFRPFPRETTPDGRNV
jgi:hypothetical protein